MDAYERFAFLYDPLISPVLRSVHDTMISLLRREGCASMVDLCCGTGMLTGMAARSGMAATGVDLSPAMLGVAAKKQPARFIRADATALPLESGSHDCATVSFSLHEKPRTTAMAILSEAMRITRPGGIVVVADYRLSTRPGWTGNMVATVERMAGKEHHAHFRQYMDQGGTDAFLREAGLTGRCERDFFHGWAGVYSIAVPEK